MKNKNKLYDNNRFIYIYIIILLIGGFITGILLSKYINTTDIDNLNSYLSILIDESYQQNYFKTQFMIGTFSILIITFLGTSIIGIPAISFLIFTKGVQIGFSCALFLLTYSYKGIIGIILIFLPQTILDLLSFYIIAHFSLLFSLNLLYGCTNKEIIPFKIRINKLLNVLLVTFLLTIASCYFKSTITISLIKFFESL